MIVWGGGYYNTSAHDFNTGGRYNPESDSWVATSIINAPAARDGHTAVWTDNEMIIWGGYDSVSYYYDTGGRYNPATDSWIATAMTNSPTARAGQTAVWTGTKMIIWGGDRAAYPYALNTGGRYSTYLHEGSHAFAVRAYDAALNVDPTPATYSWTIDLTPPVTTLTLAPANPNNSMDATFEFNCNETGCTFECDLDSSGWSACSSPKNYSINISNGWTATSTLNAPTARLYHTAVWTGSEMIVWGGVDDSLGYLNTGGRYNPVTDSWISTSTNNAPAVRGYHTAVWTGSEMIIWGGRFSSSPYYLNTGGKYNPATDSWTATSTTNAPEGRRIHTAVWTGTEMIVWGGSNSSMPDGLNSGARYDPSTDSWSQTSTTNAPSGRFGHTAIWAGSEMIIWGGAYYWPPNYHFVSAGGRYNPVDDSWTATSTTNIPAPRSWHTAAWTGSAMIIWGGWDDDVNNIPGFNTGGIYYPGTDSWTATSLTNAPSPRSGHTAVWTGTEMIVWGSDITGGRYNPLTDSWLATSATPNYDYREGHTAVWTGNGMIIWGGYGGSFLNTGYIYRPYLYVSNHSFSVRATDPAGNLELNPLIYPWTILP